jgi:hypothetical protein
MTYPRRQPRHSVSRTTLQKRVQLTQLLTMRESIDNLTAEELVRWTGLGLPECSTELERERLRRMPR